ncbi:hypothetical protein CPC08DRAFT_729904 [Agrocybe pediades]|nr:hypothetical protein CPC08DRAFT_729904 [Agrocybe pediades]
MRIVQQSTPLSGIEDQVQEKRRTVSRERYSEQEGASERMRGKVGMHQTIARRGHGEVTEVKDLPLLKIERGSPNLSGGARCFHNAEKRMARSAQKERSRWIYSTKNATTSNSYLLLLSRNWLESGQNIGARRSFHFAHFDRHRQTSEERRGHRNEESNVHSHPARIPTSSHSAVNVRRALGASLGPGTQLQKQVEQKKGRRKSKEGKEWDGVKDRK